MKKLMSILALATCFAFSANAQQTQQPMQQQQQDQESDVVDVAVQNENLSYWMKAIQASGMTAELKENGPYTVFAPSNEAFDDLGPGVFDDMMHPDNRDFLRDFVHAHIMQGEYSSDDIDNGKSGQTMGGDHVDVNQEGDKYKINGFEVVNPDINASNGVVHVIDGLMMDKEEIRNRIHVVL